MTSNLGTSNLSQYNMDSFNAFAMDSQCPADKSRHNHALSESIEISPLNRADFQRFCEHSQLSTLAIFQSAWALVTRSYTNENSVRFRVIRAVNNQPYGHGKSPQLTKASLIASSYVCCIQIAEEDLIVVMIRRVQEDYGDIEAHNQKLAGRGDYDFDSFKQMGFKTAILFGDTSGASKHLPAVTPEDAPYDQFHIEKASLTQFYPLGLY